METNEALSPFLLSSNTSNTYIKKKLRKTDGLINLISVTWLTVNLLLDNHLNLLSIIKKNKGNGNLFRLDAHKRLLVLLISCKSLSKEWERDFLLIFLTSINLLYTHYLFIYNNIFSIVVLDNKFHHKWLFFNFFTFLSSAHNSIIAIIMIWVFWAICSFSFVQAADGFVIEILMLILVDISSVDTIKSKALIRKRRARVDMCIMSVQNQYFELDKCVVQQTTEKSFFSSKVKIINVNKHLTSICLFLALE